jgi:hypothetical protein
MPSVYLVFSKPNIFSLFARSHLAFPAASIQNSAFSVINKLKKHQILKNLICKNVFFFNGTAGWDLAKHPTLFFK